MANSIAEWVVVFLLVGVIYMIPSMIARYRRHDRLRLIVILNILMGWTLIGWVIMMVWSLNDSLAPDGPGSASPPSA